MVDREQLEPNSEGMFHKQVALKLATHDYGITSLKSPVEGQHYKVINCFECLVLPAPPVE